jgi:hypothetical protein
MTSSHSKFKVDSDFSAQFLEKECEKAERTDLVCFMFKEKAEKVSKNKSTVIFGPEVFLDYIDELHHETAFRFLGHVQNSYMEAMMGEDEGQDYVDLEKGFYLESNMEKITLKELKECGLPFQRIRIDRIYSNDCETFQPVYRLIVKTR